MEVKAVSKFARISPIKARDVAREIQGMKAQEAVDLLQFIPRKAARLLSQTLRSAIANAENNNNVAGDDLTIKSALIDQGPAFKRFRPASRGMAHPYKKFTCHITIILSDEVPAEAAATK